MAGGIVRLIKIRDAYSSAGLFHAARERSIMETGVWKRVKIRTGGQSGVDRAAMDFARASECQEAYAIAKAILYQVLYHTMLT